MKAWCFKSVSFDAAHNLPHHKGPCQRLHGHTYKVEIGIESEIDPHTGMAIDLISLDGFLQMNVVSRFDHRLLNDALGVISPTAEAIAQDLLTTAIRYFDKATSKKYAGAPIIVRVWESPTAHVEVSRD